MLDEHLPLAIDLLADMVIASGAWHPPTWEREQSVILEEIKMVEDAPDDLVHEVFGAAVLGSPSARAADSGNARDGPGRSPSPALRSYFERTYLAPNVVIAAAGHLDHGRLRDLIYWRVWRALGDAPRMPTRRRPP